ncbi:glycosyltransferase [Massilia sp. PWRC2]|uniref:glycosyltransferase n=1 Tax=Massilia sp. PWRC2 TaxID=2804626 RepID=UPI003CF81B61
MSFKKILMAVESDFNLTHIGVLRVIRYHYNNLVARGHSVTLATYKEGKWITCSTLEAARAILSDTRKLQFQAPYWQSGTASRAGLAEVRPHEDGTPILWDGEAVVPEQFDESILTCPWLCSQFGKAIADSRFSVGIVYDMVPNLLALGILRMPQFIHIYRFANEHHIGYDYFMRNVETISCISESTRHDFIKLYGAHGDAEIDVCIPFADFGSGTIQDDPSGQDVLMINVLDHRKNFSTAASALKAAAAEKKLHVVIVGRERLHKDDVLKFLSELSQVCASVRWYRSPGDAQLQDLMTKAKVVFFPSFYEGLGLPILEAQARGVPVISSNVSSCGEINMNDTLASDPYDYKVFAKKLLDIFSGEVAFVNGAALRASQISHLNGKNQLFVSTTDDSISSGARSA